VDVFCFRRLLSESRRADFTGDVPAAATVAAGTALALRFLPDVTAAAAAVVFLLYRAASADEISAYNTMRWDIYHQTSVMTLLLVTSQLLPINNNTNNDIDYFYHKNNDALRIGCLRQRPVNQAVGLCEQWQ